VQRIVKAHGGTVSASSTQGTGSTFTLELPLGPQPAPHSDVQLDI
jgi:signal transduction histidine kinase